MEAKKDDEFVVPKGAGTRLRDIPNVAFKLGKIRCAGGGELSAGWHRWGRGLNDSWAWVCALRNSSS